ncbi:hypothetical protein RR48_02921 [Papilio machaon]|uniref:Uncharacterized protein n=1 Tax=Papilio machaon TaxID=76193 RepID=A0A0N1I5F9_PAPMA|nr:hypothetical protein RR48_02921 [Papilio machaon]
MDDVSGVKRAYMGRPSGRRPVGRPRYRWMDEVDKDLRELQVRDWVWERKWRLLLSEAKAHFGSLRHPIS